MSETDNRWPDILQSSAAAAMRVGNIDYTDMLDLFDKMEREIRVHRGTFCEDPSRTHETPAPQPHVVGSDALRNAVLEEAAKVAETAQISGSLMRPGIAKLIRAMKTAYEDTPGTALINRNQAAAISDFVNKEFGEQYEPDNWLEYWTKVGAFILAVNQRGSSNEA